PRRVGAHEEDPALRERRRPAPGEDARATSRTRRAADPGPDSDPRRSREAARRDGDPPRSPARRRAPRNRDELETPAPVREVIMRRVLCLAAIGLTLGAPRAAEAFCRTTTVPVAADFSPRIDKCWEQGQ